MYGYSRRRPVEVLSALLFTPEWYNYINLSNGSYGQWKIEIEPLQHGLLTYASTTVYTGNRIYNMQLLNEFDDILQESEEYTHVNTGFYKPIYNFNYPLIKGNKYRFKITISGGGTTAKIPSSSQPFTGDFFTVIRGWLNNAETSARMSLGVTGEKAYKTICHHCRFY